MMALACFTGWWQAAAQSGIYIPNKAKVFLNGDTATFFGDVINHGNLGVASKSVLNFAGSKWENSNTAHITNESDTANGQHGIGGVFRFMSNRRQQVDGAYNAVLKSGPIFCNITIDNPQGVELDKSNTKIAHNLRFVKGNLFIQQNILVVGHGQPGQILGYDDSRFIVTGNTAGNGLLMREQVSTASGEVVYPIGTKAGSYTPLAVRIKAGQPDDIYANVFNGVLTRATTGGGLVDESVAKTWELGKVNRPNAGNVEVALQHRNSDEGFYFSRNRQASYLSKYNGLYWDTVRGTGAPTQGYLTTGGALPNSGVNSRTFNNSIGNTAYFTKFAAGESSAHKTELTLYGYRINSELVNINWGTQPEVNVRHFIVQRRLSTETEFRNVASVRSKAANSTSLDHLFYQVDDPNAYTGVSYYRLQLVQLNGDTSYTEIIAVGGSPGHFNMMLWPNPSAGQFYVSINTTQPVKSIVLWDEWSQKLVEEPVQGRRIVPINLRGLANSFYYVGIYSPAGALLGMEKILLLR